MNRCTCGKGSRFPQRSMQQCVYEGVEREIKWKRPIGWGGSKKKKTELENCIHAPRHTPFSYYPSADILSPAILPY